MPTNVDAEIESWLALGLQRFGEGKCSEAVSHWFRVLDLDPEHSLAIERIRWVRELFHVEIQTDAWGSQSQMVLLADEAEDGAGMLPEIDIDLADWQTEGIENPATHTVEPGRQTALGSFEHTANVGDMIAGALRADKGAPSSAALFENMSEKARIDRQQSDRSSLVTSDGIVELSEHSAFTIALPTITQINAADAGGPAPIDLGWSNPWDASESPTEAVDLDLSPVLPNRIHEILSLYAGSGERVSARTGKGRARTARPLAAPDASLPGSLGEQVARLMAQAEHRFALGDFSGAEREIRALLQIKPDDEEALACLASIESMLLKMFESTLGDLRHAPKMVSSADEVIWLNLHQRAAFLLAQIDGSLTYEDLIAVSGLGRLETFRILSELVRARVIQ